MNKGFRLSIPRRMGWIRIVLVFSFLISVLATLRLWAGDHLFPAACVIPSVETEGAFSMALIIMAGLFLVASLIFNWYRLFLFLGLLCITLLVLLDVNRLQQWVFIYGIMLFVIVLYNGRVDDPNKFTSYFINLQIIVCGVYFYTGLHQFQPGFISEEFAVAIAPLELVLTPRQFHLALKLGQSIPVLLMFTSVALFVRPMRYLGITFAVMLHMALIILRYPLIVGDVPGYIFNFTMLLMVLLLFWGKTKQRYYNPVFILQQPLFYLTILLFLIMPAFNNAGRWPDELSANVRTGNRQKTEIFIPVATYLRLPQYVKNFVVPREGRMFLDHAKWCRFDLGVSCSSSAPAIGSLIRQLEFWNRGPVKDMELRTLHKRDLLVLH